MDPDIRTDLKMKEIYNRIHMSVLLRNLICNDSINSCFYLHYMNSDLNNNNNNNNRFIVALKKFL
jgi:hypothetical protein